MMVNRYKGCCWVCGGPVAPLAGNLRKINRVWRVFHLACAEGAPGVVTFQVGGQEFTRNARGRCEDAPCCGCCTI